MNPKNFKALVRGMYDCQQLRIMTGLRVVANFKAKLGQAPGERETELDAEGKKILGELRASYTKLTDGITRRPKLKIFKGDELITDYAEFSLIHNYMNLERAEKDLADDIEEALVCFPIYTKFLKAIKGCGPLMSAVIISEIDIHKAKYVSSMWAYAGLSTGSDGKAISRRAEHLRDISYKNKKGEDAVRKGITYNAFLRTKLLGVLGGSFLKVKDSPYAEIYYNYKNRLENHVVYKDVSKGHRHAMAIRYMVKQFIVDLYTHWKELEGLKVELPYAEAKLGYTHGRNEDATISK